MFTYVFGESARSILHVECVLKYTLLSRVSCKSQSKQIASATARSKCSVFAQYAFLWGVGNVNTVTAIQMSA